MKLCLANVDYRSHMTSEGDQLQSGLEHSGWQLAGAGFGDDGCRDLPRLIDRHKPEFVFISDKRDWDPTNRGSYRKDIGFTRLGALAQHAEIIKLAVVKDAGSVQEYHRQFCEEVGADLVVTYYHDRSVLAVSPWLQGYERIRTYHTIDSELVALIPMTVQRKRALVSGAQNHKVYPLRNFVTKHAGALRCDVLPHAGYGNVGCDTANYLRTLARYKVHVATSSAYGFALRKIIESVAVGTTPVTDLPSYDVLPGIDEALVRIRPDSGFSEVKDAIDHAEQSWNLEHRMELARKAREFYDFRAMGARLDAAIVSERVSA